VQAAYPRSTARGQPGQLRDDLYYPDHRSGSYSSGTSRDGSRIRSGEPADPLPYSHSRTVARGARELVKLSKRSHKRGTGAAENILAYSPPLLSLFLCFCGL